MEPSSSSQRKRHSSSSSSTTSSTSTSSNNEEDLGSPSTKQPKIERNSDYPSFHSQQKSSTSTTDSEGESPSEGGPDVRGRDRRKRALCDEDEGPKKPVPSYSSFSMEMMVSGCGLNTFLINLKILSVFVNINENWIAFL